MSIDSIAAVNSARQRVLYPSELSGVREWSTTQTNKGKHLEPAT